MRDDPSAAGSRFPTTRMSALAALGSDDPALRARSFATLALGYYKPVYKHVRMKWRKVPDEAADITQDFFAVALEKNFFQGYDPRLSRFRTYVRMCLDRFVAKQCRAARRKKRGGDAVLESLDFAGAEAEIAAFGLPAPNEIDAYFDREWARHVFGTALAALQAACAARGQMVRYRIFERYEIAGGGEEKPSYADVARELGIPATTVTNHLHQARHELRRLVMETLRDLTPTEEEFRSEVRALLGVDPPGPLAPGKREKGP